MNNARMPPPRCTDPFDDSTRERQRRMGLLNAADEPELNTIAVVASLYASLYYDDLCDYFSDLSDVRTICHALSGRVSETDARPKFLAICTAYDAIYRTLPEPVWWIAGNLELAGPFADGFLRRLAELSEEVC